MDRHDYGDEYGDEAGHRNEGGGEFPADIAVWSDDLHTQ